MPFHAFHYPFTLRVPPRWKLIHGCLRMATVRLVMHREEGVVPRWWRARRARRAEERRRVRLVWSFIGALRDGRWNGNWDWAA
jgi:hypothetical protein